MKKPLCLIMFIFIVGFSLFGNSNLSLNVRFYDKTIYYPESDIFLKIEIKNESINDPITFNIADAKEYNLRFMVRSMNNQEEPLSENYLHAKESALPYFYRQVSLSPGEEFSFIINLKDYIEITQPGLFVLQGDFFPLLEEISRDISVRSNQLSLSVRPSLYNNNVEDQIAVATQEILRQEKLSPDQVVDYVISSRQSSDWDRFFLYIDLEELMIQNPELHRIYNNAGEEERRAMLNQYRIDIASNNGTDRDRVMIDIPNRYEVLYTHYNNEDGEVKVREYFDRGYTEVRDYIYYLKKVEDIWMIWNYEVINIRTQ